MANCVYKYKSTKENIKEDLNLVADRSILLGKYDSESAIKSNIEVDKEYESISSKLTKWQSHLNTIGSNLKIADEFELKSNQADLGSSKKVPRKYISLKLNDKAIEALDDFRKQNGIYETKQSLESFFFVSSKAALNFNYEEDPIVNNSEYISLNLSFDFVQTFAKSLLGQFINTLDLNKEITANLSDVLKLILANKKEVQTNIKRIERIIKTLDPKSEDYQKVLQSLNTHKNIIKDWRIIVNNFAYQYDNLFNDSSASLEKALNLVLDNEEIGDVELQNEDGIETNEDNQYDADRVITLNPKDRFGVHVRALLASLVKPKKGIPIVALSKDPIFKDYYSFDKILKATYTILSISNEHYYEPTWEIYKKNLLNNAKKFPWVNQLVEKLDENEFLRQKFIKQVSSIDPNYIQYIVDGKTSFEVFEKSSRYDANQRDIAANWGQKLFSILSKQNPEAEGKKLSFTENYKELINNTYNVIFGDPNVNRDFGVFGAWMKAKKYDPRDKRTAESQSKAIAQLMTLSSNYLALFGITLSDSTLLYLITNEPSALQTYLKDLNSKSNGPIDYNSTTRGTLISSGRLKGLINVEGEFNQVSSTLTDLQNGKQVSTFQDNRKLVENFARAKNDKKYQEELENDPYSKNSMWLKQMKSQRRQFIQYQTLALNFLDDGSNEDISEYDARKLNLAKLVAFTAPSKTKFDHGSLHQSLFISSSLSDSKFLIGFRTFKLDFESDNGTILDALNKKINYPLKTESNSIIWGIKPTWEILFEQLIEPEINRVKSDKYKNQLNDFFFNIPELNAYTLDTLIDVNTGLPRKENIIPILDEILSKQVQDVVDYFESNNLGFVKAKNSKGQDIVRRSGVSDTEMTKRYNNSNFALALDMHLNYMIAQANEHMVVTRDPALYAKVSKESMEKYLETSRTNNLDLVEEESIDAFYNVLYDTLDNMSKRLKFFASPRQTFDPIFHKTRGYRYLVHKDLETPVNVKKYVFRTLFRNELIRELPNGYKTKNLEEAIDLKIDEIIEKGDYLNKGDKYYSAFWKNNHADAQEFVHWKAHLQLLVEMAEMSMGNYKKLVNKIEKNPDSYELTDEELKYFSARKPLYVGESIEEGGKVQLHYVKSSYIPLLPRSAGGLAPLLEKMDGKKGAGLDDLPKYDRITFSSAIKLGLPKAQADFFNDDMSLKSDFVINPSEGYIMELPPIGYGKQVNVPPKNKLEGSDPVQVKKLLFNGIGKEMIRFEGEWIRVEDLKARYNRIYSEILKEQAEEQLSRLISEGSLDYRKINDLLRDEMHSYTVDEKESIKFEDGRFVIPLWMTPNRNKYEALISSVLNKAGITKLKRPVKGMVQVSSIGQVTDKIPDNSDSVFTKAYDPKKGLQYGKIEKDKYGDDTVVAQIMLPWYFEQDINKYIDPETGKIELDPELLRGLGYRIPNQGHSSMIQYEIVGFVKGINHVIVPTELVTQMGSDFDVDKLFLTFKEWELDFNGRLVPKQSPWNEIVDIEKAITGSTNHVIRKKITQPLDGPLDEIDEITKTLPSQNKGRKSFLSFLYQTERYIIGAESKIGTAVGSSKVTLQAQLEGYNVRVRDIFVDENDKAHQVQISLNGVTSFQNISNRFTLKTQEKIRDWFYKAKDFFWVFENGDWRTLKKTEANIKKYGVPVLSYKELINNISNNLGVQVAFEKLEDNTIASEYDYLTDTLIFNTDYNHNDYKVFDSFIDKIIDDYMLYNPEHSIRLANEAANYLGYTGVENRSDGWENQTIKDALMQLSAEKITKRKQGKFLTLFKEFFEWVKNNINKSFIAKKISNNEAITVKELSQIQGLYTLSDIIFNYGYMQLKPKRNEEDDLNSTKSKEDTIENELVSNKNKNTIWENFKDKIERDLARLVSPTNDENSRGITKEQLQEELKDLPQEIQDIITIIKDTPDFLDEDTYYSKQKELYAERGITDRLAISWWGSQSYRDINKKPIFPQSTEEIYDKANREYNQLIEKADKYLEKSEKDLIGLNNLLSKEKDYKKISDVKRKIKQIEYNREEINNWKNNLKNVSPLISSKLFEYAIKNLKDSRRDRFVYDSSKIAIEKTIKTLENNYGLINNIGKVYDTYQKQAVYEAFSPVSAETIEGAFWITIPKTKPSSPDYKRNVKTFKKLSPDYWCTSSSFANNYVEKYDNVLLIVDGEVVVGIEVKEETTKSGKRKVKDVTSINNNNVASIDFLDETLSFMKKNNISTKDANGAIEKAKKKRKEGKVDDDYIKDRTVYRDDFDEEELTDYIENIQDVDQAIELIVNNVDSITYYHHLFPEFLWEDERFQIEAVKNDGDVIQHILDKGIIPSKEVQLEAVKKYGTAIKYIDNPSKEVQLEAVKNDGDAIRYIIGKRITPSKDVQLEAVKKDGNTIRYIINGGITPSEDVQLEAVKEDGHAIQHIENPSEDVQLEAVKQNGNVIYTIIRKGITPSENVQIEAVKQNGRAIIFIDNPSKDIQLEAVKTSNKFSKSYGIIDGFYNSNTDQVTLVSNNLRKSDVVKVALHEVAHRGLVRMAKELGGEVELYEVLKGAEKQLMEKLPELLERTGHTSLEDLLTDYGFEDNEEGHFKLLSELTARWAETFANKPVESWWKKLLQRVGQWIKQFTGKELTESEVNNLVGNILFEGTRVDEISTVNQDKNLDNNQEFKPANKEQKEAIETIEEHIDSNNDTPLVINGKAGTGKTTIIGQALKKYSGVIVGALSNNATKLIHYKTTEIKENDNGSVSKGTISSMLGEVFDRRTGRVRYIEKGRDGELILPPIYAANIIVIDEASMVSERMLDLINKAKKGRVIFLGDSGQLPPIRDFRDYKLMLEEMLDDNPSEELISDYQILEEMVTNLEDREKSTNPVDIKEFERLDKKAKIIANKYGLDFKPSPVFSINNKNNIELKERVRQGESSPILPYADYYWNNSHKESPIKDPVPEENKVSKVTNEGSLVFSNSKSIYESIIPLFKRAINEGNSNLIRIVSYTNDSRRKANNLIRKTVYGENPNFIEPNEIIMFNKKYRDFQNGDQLQLTGDVDEIVENGYRVFKAYYFDIEDNIIQSIRIVHPNDKAKFQSHLNELAKQAKLNPTLWNSFWNLKDSYADVDYAYAITSHKAQGATYDITVVNSPDIMRVTKTNSVQKSQSMYTAITRSKYITFIIDDAREESKNIQEALDIYESNKGNNALGKLLEEYRDSVSISNTKELAIDSNSSNLHNLAEKLSSPEVKESFEQSVKEGLRLDDALTNAGFTSKEISTLKDESNQLLTRHIESYINSLINEERLKESESEILSDSEQVQNVKDSIKKLSSAKAQRDINDPSNTDLKKVLEDLEIPEEHQEIILANPNILPREDVQVYSSLNHALDNLTETKISKIYKNYIESENENNQITEEAFKALIDTYQVLKHGDNYIFGNYDQVNAVFVGRIVSSSNYSDFIENTLPKILEQGIDFVSFIDESKVEEYTTAGYTITDQSHSSNLNGQESPLKLAGSRSVVFDKIFGKDRSEISSEDMENYNNSIANRYTPVRIDGRRVQEAKQDMFRVLKKYLASFGITVDNMNSIKNSLNMDEVGIADLISKIAYIDDRKDLGPIAGEFIAHMMQNDVLIKEIVDQLIQSRTIIVKDSKQVEDRLEYNYQDLDKSKIFKYIGNLISKDLQNKLNKRYDESLIGIIKRLVRKFFNKLYRTDVKLINKNIGIISNNIIQQNTELVNRALYKLERIPKSQSLEKAMENDALATNLLEQLSYDGFIMSGSVALNKQGDYSTKDPSIKVINFLSPFSEDRTSSKVTERYPNSHQVSDTKWLIPPKNYYISNLELSGDTVISYEISDQDGNVKGTYKLSKNSENNLIEDVSGLEAKELIIKPYDGFSDVKGKSKKKYLSWENILEDQLGHKNTDGAWDYNNFVPPKNKRILNRSKKSNNKGSEVLKSLENLKQELILKEFEESPLFQESRNIRDVLMFNEYDDFQREIPSSILERYGINPKYTIDGHVGFQSASVDNINRQVLEKINYNRYVSTVAHYLVSLGYESKTIVNFLTQPVIKEYVENIQKSGLGYDTSFVSSATVIDGLVEKYAALSGMSEEEFINFVNSPKKTINRLEDYDDSPIEQLKVILLFGRMMRNGISVTSLGSILNIDSKGAGNNIYDFIAKLQSYYKVVDSKKLTNVDKVLRNSTSAININHLKSAVQVIVSDDNQMSLYSNSIFTDSFDELKQFIQDSKGNFTEYDSKNISKALVNAIRAFITTQIFSEVVGDPNEYLDRLTNIKKRNLGKIVSELKLGKFENKDLSPSVRKRLSNSKLITRLKVSYPNGGTSWESPIYSFGNLIKLGIESTRDSLTEDVNQDMRELYLGNYPLSDSYTTKDLVRDLIYYTYLTGYSLTGGNLMKFIPADFNNAFFNGRIDSALDSLKDYIVDSSQAPLDEANPNLNGFLLQVLLNNADTLLPYKAPMSFEKDEHRPIMIRYYNKVYQLNGEGKYVPIGKPIALAYGPNVIGNNYTTQTPNKIFTFSSPLTPIESVANILQNRFSKIITLMQDKSMEMPKLVRKKIQGGKKGMYNRRKGEIVIDPSVKDKDEFGVIYFHELGHHLQYDTLLLYEVQERVGEPLLTQEQTDAIKRLEEVYERLKNKKGSEAFYAFKDHGSDIANLHEFMTEMMTNSNLRHWVNNKKGLLAEIYDLIANFFRALTNSEIITQDIMSLMVPEGIGGVETEFYKDASGRVYKVRKVGNDILDINIRENGQTSKSFNPDALYSSLDKSNPVDQYSYYTSEEIKQMFTDDVRELTRFKDDQTGIEYLKNEETGEIYYASSLAKVTFDWSLKRMPNEFFYDSDRQVTGLTDKLDKSINPRKILNTQIKYTEIFSTVNDRLVDLKKEENLLKSNLTDNLITEAQYKIELNKLKNSYDLALNLANTIAQAKSIKDLAEIITFTEAQISIAINNPEASELDLRYANELIESMSDNLTSREHEEGYFNQNEKEAFLELDSNGQVVLDVNGNPKFVPELEDLNLQIKNFLDSISLGGDLSLALNTKEEVFLKKALEEVNFTRKEVSPVNKEDTGWFSAYAIGLDGVDDTVTITGYKKITSVNMQIQESYKTKFEHLKDLTDKAWSEIQELDSRNKRDVPEHGIYDVLLDEASNFLGYYSSSFIESQSIAILSRDNLLKLAGKEQSENKARAMVRKAWSNYNKWVRDNLFVMNPLEFLDPNDFESLRNDPNMPINLKPERLDMIDATGQRRLDFHADRMAKLMKQYEDDYKEFKDSLEFSSLTDAEKTKHLGEFKYKNHPVYVAYAIQDLKGYTSTYKVYPKMKYTVSIAKRYSQKGEDLGNYNAKFDRIWQGGYDNILALWENYMQIMYDILAHAPDYAKKGFNVRNVPYYFNTAVSRFWMIMKSIRRPGSFKALGNLFLEPFSDGIDRENNDIKDSNRINDGFLRQGVLDVNKIISNKVRAFIRKKYNLDTPEDISKWINQSKSNKQEYNSIRTNIESQVKTKLRTQRDFDLLRIMRDHLLAAETYKIKSRNANYVALINSIVKKRFQSAGHNRSLENWDNAYKLFQGYSTRKYMSKTISQTYDSITGNNSQQEEEPNSRFKQYNPVEFEYKNALEENLIYIESRIEELELENDPSNDSKIEDLKKERKAIKENIATLGKNIYLERIADVLIYMQTYISLGWSVANFLTNSTIGLFTNKAGTTGRLLSLHKNNSFYKALYTRGRGKNILIPVITSLLGAVFSTTIASTLGMSAGIVSSGLFSTIGYFGGKALANLIPRSESREVKAVYGFMNRFNLLQKNQNDLFVMDNPAQGSPKSKILNKLRSFSLGRNLVELIEEPFTFTTEAELLNQAGNVGTRLMGIFTKDKDGNIINFIDALNEDGQFIDNIPDNPEYIINETNERVEGDKLVTDSNYKVIKKFNTKHDFLIYVASEVNPVITTFHGNYVTADKPIVKNYTIGMLLAQFKTWMAKLYDFHFGKLKTNTGIIDLKTGEEWIREGFLNTLSRRAGRLFTFSLISLMGYGYSTTGLLLSGQITTIGLATAGLTTMIIGTAIYRANRYMDQSLIKSTAETRRKVRRYSLSYLGSKIPMLRGDKLALNRAVDEGLIENWEKDKIGIAFNYILAGAATMTLHALFYMLRLGLEPDEEEKKRNRLIKRKTGRDVNSDESLKRLVNLGVSVSGSLHSDVTIFQSPLEFIDRFNSVDQILPAVSIGKDLQRNTDMRFIDDEYKRDDPSRMIEKGDNKNVTKLIRKAPLLKSFYRTEQMLTEPYDVYREK